jgi:hypothetical protein
MQEQKYIAGVIDYLPVATCHLAATTYYLAEGYLVITPWPQGTILVHLMGAIKGWSAQEESKTIRTEGSYYFS